MPRGVPWDIQEDLLLIECAGKKSLSEIAEELAAVRGITYTPKAIAHRIYRLNQRRGLRLTTAVVYRQWVCVNCGQLTCYPTDEEGWCEECLLVASIERTQRDIEAEERCQLLMSSSPSRHTKDALRKAQAEENRLKLRALQREYGAKRAKLYRLREANGTRPKG